MELPPASSLSTRNTSFNVAYECFDVRSVAYSYLSFCVVYVLFCCPLTVYIFYLSHHRRQQRHSIGEAIVNSTADLYTYNIIVIDVLSFLGSLTYCSGIFVDNQLLMMFGVYLYKTFTPGQLGFQCLTCIEHYLAIVHPITYMRLRKANSSQVTYICIATVWIFSLSSAGLASLSGPEFPKVQFIIYYSIMVIFISFFRFSARRNLIGPGPGAVGGDREKDRMKRRALLTIRIITSVQLYGFGSQIFTVSLYMLKVLDKEANCLVAMSAIWYTFPSCFVLPLLFIHRAGRLPCYNYDAEAGSINSE